MKTHPLSVSTEAGNPQVVAASWKVSVTAWEVVTVNTRLAVMSREQSSMMFPNSWTLYEPRPLPGSYAPP